MYETLLREAENEGIEVVYLKLSDNLKGLYCDNVIALDSNIIEKAITLVEELGHFHTSHGNILDQTKMENRKQERRARRWGYERLVPLDKIVRAHQSGARDQFELAEFLEVTIEFLEAAIKHYQERYGTHYRNQHYLISLEPLDVLEVY